MKKEFITYRPWSLQGAPGATPEVLGRARNTEGVGRGSAFTEDEGGAEGLWAHSLLMNLKHKSGTLKPEGRSPNGHLPKSTEISETKARKQPSVLSNGVAWQRVYST